MKKFILITCFCAFAISAFAQEEKPALDKALSPDLAAFQTAASLAKYGYENYSATALIEAAKIFSETKTQELEEQGTPESVQTVSEKDKKVCFDPKQLLADAKKFAGKDKVVLAFADQVEKSLKSSTTRGAVGGPREGAGRVYGKSYTDYQIKFWASEVAEIAVVGDGDTDLDLYVYDERGNLITSDTDYTDQCICRWIPAWTGTFTVRIVNRGTVYNEYVIVTN